MAAGGSRAVLGLWLLAAGLCGAVAASRSPSCHEVRTAFQLRQIGPLKLVPDVPTAGQYRATRGWPRRDGRGGGAGLASAGLASAAVPPCPPCPPRFPPASAASFGLGEGSEAPGTPLADRTQLFPGRESGASPALLRCAGVACRGLHPRGWSAAILR